MPLQESCKHYKNIEHFIKLKKNFEFTSKLIQTVHFYVPTIQPSITKYVHPLEIYNNLNYQDHEFTA